jgi:hypothetical protein
MTARLLVARQRTTHIYIVVHIDTSKVLEDGTTPDPDWVMRFRYPFPVPQEFTAAQYRAWIKDRIREIVTQTLDERQADTAGVALPEEGTDL